MLGVSFVLAAAAGVVLYRKKILHPKAFGATEAKQRDVWGVPAPVWFVCAAMVFLGHQVCVGLAMALPPGVRGELPAMKAVAVPQLLGYAGALVVGLLLVWLLRPKTSAKSGLSAGWSDVWVGALALALAAPFYVLVSTLSQVVQRAATGAPPPDVAHKTLELILAHRDDPWAWGVVIAAVVMAPIVEELTHRAFLQSSLLGLIGKTWPAILMTSAFFTLVHTSVAPAAAWPGLFTLSIALGLAFERTRRIGVPIVMHVLFNAANVVIAVVSARGA